MSFGKMNTFIDIISTALVKDSEGFAASGDTRIMEASIFDMVICRRSTHNVICVLKLCVR